MKSEWRYIRIALVAAAVIIGSALVERNFARGSAGRIAAALVQTAATVVVIVTSLGSIRKLDEMQQRIQLEALAFAFAGTGVLMTAYGFLLDAGLPLKGWGELAWPMMAVLWAVGFVFAGRRYRGGEDLHG